MATRLITADERPTGVGARVAPAKKAQLVAADDAKPEPVQGRTMLVHVLGPDGHPMPGVKLHRSVWTRKPIGRANNELRER